MLRFRLRTLLIVVAVLALPMAWVGHSWRWAVQRRAAKYDVLRIVVVTEEDALSGDPGPPPPPGLLTWFGEFHVAGIICEDGDEKRMVRLFPEAWVTPRSKAKDNAFFR
jgi:hypothetical protein